VTVPAAPADVLATPYPVHWCYKWLDIAYAIYSYTEDSDYDGKLDRIRVTTETSIPISAGQFASFLAEVDGYTVTGYSIPEAGYNFYILLEEKNYLDTDATPDWRVASNASLKDVGGKFIGTVSRSGGSDWMTPGDTAWPLVAYSLSLPNLDGTFVAFSEPVVRNGGVAISETDFTPNTGAASIVTSSAAGVEEIVVPTGARTPATLALGASTFTVEATTRDSGAPPYWEAAYANQVVGYPAPRYPPVGGYALPSTYALAGPAPTILVPTVQRPSFQLQRGSKHIHRVSDVLVSIPPSAAYPASYFAWPVWAKDSVTLESSEAEVESWSADDSEDSGIGLITGFDGSRYLRDQDITLVARTYDDSVAGLQLVYDNSVAAPYRSPYGLWLPPYDPADFSGAAIVPNADVSTLAAVDGGTALWRFAILATDSKLVSGTDFEFFFRLAASPADLYVARLAIEPGAAVPTNWYRLVMPFAFEVHDVPVQAGRVTIVNNVIDPTKDETVKVSYQLAAAGTVSIVVYTLDGDVVRVLFSGTRAPGDYSVAWDGRNGAGLVVARGVYFIRVVGPGIDEIRKVMVVK
jgi:hypothetical protein